LARELEAAYGPGGAKEGWIEPAVFIVGPARDGVGAAPCAIVQGEVKHPGRRIPVHEWVRLVHALMKAGGFTEFSAVDRIQLIRGGNELTFDLTPRVKAETNPLLEDGDVIIVPRK
jgi:protein involved in polysaccharide export with SLBB domain